MVRQKGKCMSKTTMVKVASTPDGPLTWSEDTYRRGDGAVDYIEVRDGRLDGSHLSNDDLEARLRTAGQHPDPGRAR